MIDFGGWEMPVHYKSIIKEHNAVRDKAGLFDVSHMGEIRLKGKDALSNLQYLITNDISKSNVGQALYTVMCNSSGGIIDDFLVYRLAEDEFLLIVNAANIEKDFKWIKDNTEDKLIVENLSENYGLLALQGPKSEKILDRLTDIDLSQIKQFHFRKDKLAGKKAILSKTGYTGELGYEIYLAPEDLEYIWNKLLSEGEDFRLTPAGLGARNTLRLEKKLCLYGNDIDENTDPFAAGLNFAVKMNKGDFIGRDSLLEIREKGIDRKLIGFKLTERGIARHGHMIKKDDKEIGFVTSGSFSPTCKENIGLGYVKIDQSDIGNELGIIIRGRSVKAEIVKTPFV